MRSDWQNVMTAEEVEEFGAIETARAHLKEALAALSRRRDKIRNRLVMRLNWRAKHVGDR